MYEVINLGKRNLTEMIRISKEVKRFLDKKKLVERETYDSVIKRLLKIR